MSINTVNAYNQYGYSGTNGVNQQRIQNFAGNSENNVNQSVFATQPSSVCADGKDDGSISLGNALGSLLKGGIKLFTGMFTDQNGNFSLGQTFNSLLTVGLIGAATFIPVIGPFVVPALCTYGMIDGALGVFDAFDKMSSAKTDAEAEAAWESLGSHATEGVLSYVGYKASGGFSAAKDAASADWADLKSKWNSSGSSTPKTSASTAETTSGASTEATAETTVDQTSHVSKSQQVLDKAKTKEPQVRVKNELAEGVRRDIINEKAARVDAGESLAPSHAEIAEQGRNLDISHLSGNDRALVGRAYNDIPTAEQQAIYDRNIAYQAAPKQDVIAAQQKGVQFVEQPVGNAAQTLAESNEAAFKTLQARMESAPKPATATPQVLTEDAIKLQIQSTGQIPNGKYMVELGKNQMGVYEVYDGNITIIEQAGSPFTGKNIELSRAKHIAKVDKAIRAGHFII